MIFRNLILILITVFFSGCNNSDQKKEIKNTKTTQTQSFRNGDIIFQTSVSDQSQAIQFATGSRYSHMGIIFKNGGNYYVYEAVQPVSYTPLNSWIKRGKNDHYVVKRLKKADSVLTDKTFQRMQEAGKKYYGKNYDLYFEWSDKNIYCSELVWKIYKEGTGLEIGNLQTLKSFNLDVPVVKQKMKERYGNNLPLHEKVISPVAMFNSDLLVTVSEN